MVKTLTTFPHFFSAHVSTCESEMYLIHAQYYVNNEIDPSRLRPGAFLFFLLGTSSYLFYKRTLP